MILDKIKMICPLGSRPSDPLERVNVETVDEDPYWLDDDQDD